jgi:hypothetical protein
VNAINVGIGTVLRRCSSEMILECIGLLLGVKPEVAHGKMSLNQIESEMIDISEQFWWLYQNPMN